MRDTEDDPAAFGRALIRLSELNETPLRLGRGPRSHPDTLDRALACGVSLSEPVPEPPRAQLGWQGTILLLLILAAGFFLPAKLRYMVEDDAYRGDSQALRSIAITGGSAYDIGWLGLSWVYDDDLRANRVDTGLRLMEFATRLSSDPTYRMDYAEALIDTRHFDAARAALGQGVEEYDPETDRDLAIRRAVLLARLGDRGATLTALNRLAPLSRDVGAADLAEHAAILAVAGKDELAVETFQLARQRVAELEHDEDEVDSATRAIEWLATDLDGGDVPGADILRSVLPTD